MITNVIFSVGLLLVAALVGAILAEKVRVPKVTAYLLVGLALGHHGLGLLREDHAESLEPFNDMAMALVLFNLGCQFSLERFRTLLRKLVPVSAGEQILCFLLVSLATGVATGNAVVGTLLGVMAMATAPATTVLVLKESQADGPVTDLCGGLVAFNNLTCIVVFELVYVLIQSLTGNMVGSVFGHLGGVFGGLAVATTVGVASGLLVSFVCGLVAGKRLLVLLIGTIALVLGACELLAVPYLLAFLAMGVVVVNTSPNAKVITKELGQTTTLLCVLFFVLHGSHLDVQAFLSAGVIGMLYILTRMAGKYIGTSIVTRRQGEENAIQSWLGLTLMAQAGVAIALCSAIEARGMADAKEIRAIILGSVVFFEIAGPLLIRHAVYQAGEMPLGQAFPHAATSPREQWDEMRNRFSIAIGRKQLVSQSPVGIDTLVARDVEGLNESAGFMQVIEYIEHSHDNTFPVVNSGGVATGVIRYSAISNAMFDPEAIDLVCAEDLAEPLAHSVGLGETVSGLVELFNQTTDDCVVVSDPDSQKFLGVVRRGDVMNLLVRGHRSPT